MILKNGKRIDGLGDNMPIGSIIEYNGTDIPDGWEILPGDANVYIGKDKPAEGQEIWIQRGKNLLNMNKVKNGCGLTSNLDDQGFVEDANWFLSHPIPVEGGKSYFTSGLYYANGDIQTFKEFYDKEHNFILNVKSNPAIAPDNAAYMYVDGRIDRSNEAMVIQGTEASAYEPYLGKRIFVKNDRGVYEEFYNEEEYDKNHYSLKEYRIGTWINGKPLYRLVVQYQATPDNNYYMVANNSQVSQIIMSMESVARFDTFVENGTVIVPLPSNGDYESRVYLQRSYGGLGVIATSSSVANFSGNTITAIIEYTKK
jgi:hypothetical protein